MIGAAMTSSSLVSVPIDEIRVDTPLPVPLYGSGGQLLAAAGQIIASRQELERLVDQGVGLFIHEEHTKAYRRAYVEHLHAMVEQNSRLGEIADSQFVSAFHGMDPMRARAQQPEQVLDWLDLQAFAHSVLREPESDEFLRRLQLLQREIIRHARHHPDLSLFAWHYLASIETRRYSATHAIFVSVMCNVAAREVLHWPEATIASLTAAALTMNLGMMPLQDELAQQLSPVTADQQSQIDVHATQSAIMLESAGVKNRAWLTAVRQHHTAGPGRIEGRPVGYDLARLIRRADIFAAQLSPRAGREPVEPARAMKALYRDERGDVDEAGAALIKAVGIYSPGSMVKLASNEIGVVLRRGAKTTEPTVAVVIKKDGIPTADPIIRETSQPSTKVVASIPRRMVKVNIPLSKLSTLVQRPVVR